jgi:hypothetical protein
MKKIIMPKGRYSDGGRGSKPIYNNLEWGWEGWWWWIFFV